MSKWTQSDTDKMLDLFFSGMSTVEVAERLRASVQNVRMRLKPFLFNIDDRAKNYQSNFRVSRKSKSLSFTEKKVIETYQQNNIPLKYLVKLLQRPLSEIDPDDIGKAKAKVMKDVATGTDLVLAHRYLYHCTHTSIISDQAYDDLKAEEMEYGGGHGLLSQKASDLAIDYPPHIRSLAYYLQFKKWLDDKCPKDMEKQLPYALMMEYKSKKEKVMEP